MEILLISIVIGLIPALIASSKGRSFLGWWIYGALLFIVALVHSLVIKKDVQFEEKEKLEFDGMKKCPFCAELIKKKPSNASIVVVICYQVIILQKQMKIILRKPDEKSGKNNNTNRFGGFFVSGE